MLLFVANFPSVSSQNTSETAAKELLAPKIAVQQFAVKIPINSDNFPIINFPVYKEVVVAIRVVEVVIEVVVEVVVVVIVIGEQMQ